MYKLTLRQSSYLFLESVNLVKNQPLVISEDILSNKEKTILNKYITSGGVISNKGLFEIEEAEAVEAKVVEVKEVEKVDEAPVETVEETKEEVTEVVVEVKEEVVEDTIEEPKVEVEVKKPATRRAPAKKK